MTLWAARLNSKLNFKWTLILFLIFLLACQFSAPGQPQATPLPTLPDLAAATAGPATITPAPEEGVTPGTVILDQTTPLSATQGDNVELVFDAVALQVINLDSTLVDGTLDYKLSLVDKFGNLLVSLESNPGVMVESLPEFAVPYEGTYRIVLSPSKGEGNLHVVVTGLASASGGGIVGGIGQIADGMISSPRVYHTYQISLNQGDIITVSAKANVLGSPDMHLTLYGPDGQYITEADDVAPPVDLDAIVTGHVVSISGVYTAIVSSVGTAIGAYTFEITSDAIPPEAQGDPDIIYNHEYRAAFYEGSNLTATFDGNIGDVISIEVFNLDEEVDLDIYLRSPFGQIIAYAVGEKEGEDEAINEVQLPYAGRYQLELKPYGAGHASFRANLLPNSATGGGTFGDELSKVLPGSFAQPTVFHVYQFNANAGDRISLAVHSVNQNGELEIGFALLGTNGLQLIFADDSTGDNPSDPELDYQVTQTGTFTVIVYSFNDATGTYDLVYSRK
ncbi:MAG: PPC domain-containing protein [Anaerolineae bacterium]|nr:PPC domain-containing protein [Anaerolineae bacterium]